MRPTPRPSTCPPTTAIRGAQRENAAAASSGEPLLRRLGRADDLLSAQQQPTPPPWDDAKGANERHAAGEATQAWELLKKAALFVLMLLSILRLMP